MTGLEVGKWVLKHILKSQYCEKILDHGVEWWRDFLPLLLLEWRDGVELKTFFGVE